MNKNYLIILLTALFAVVSVGIFAQGREVNPIPVAAPVLSIAPDARAGGMGDAGVATAPDVYSQHWNPSKYAFHTRGAGVAVSYTPWLRKIVNDVALMNVVGFWKPGREDNQAISASLKYFKIGEVNMTKGNWYPGGDWGADDYNVSASPYEMAFDVSYSRKLSNSFSMAVALRYIRVDYAGFSDEASSSDVISADIAAYLERYINIGDSESLLTFGGNISNITGAKISIDEGNTTSFVPTNLRLGASLMYPVTEVSTFSFSLDINKLLVPTPPMKPIGADENSEEWLNYLEKKDKYLKKNPIGGIFSSFGDADSFSEELKEIMWSLGVEYDYDSKFKVRSGYFYENKMKGNRQYFSFGAGFKFNMFQLDAAYMVSTASNNPLDQTLRLSLAFDIPVSNRF